MLEDVGSGGGGVVGNNGPIGFAFASDAGDPAGGKFAGFDGIEIFEASVKRAGGGEAEDNRSYKSHGTMIVSMGRNINSGEKGYFSWKA